MRIRELLATGQPSISFEFFPPRSPAGAEALKRTIGALRDLHPTFVSVTYGAGGSTRAQTIEIVTHIQREYGILPMAHLTCLGASRQEIHTVLQRLAREGIENVLALRGDPPQGNATFQPHPDGFAHANELVAYIRRHFDFCIGAACYPEKHPEAPDPETDLRNLKRKVEAGCQFLITQLFFNNRHYFEFVARCRTVGIGVPIIPGIMPITNVAQVERFTKMCGASIPPGLWEELQRLKHDANAVLSLGVAHATAQCLELLQRGAPGIHFYTLNKSPATRMILKAIQVVYPPAQRPAGFRG